MVVNAVQCKEAKTVATDLGFNVRQGEWLICGENGETYIVDDAFFQRTFVSAPEGPRIQNRAHLEVYAIEIDRLKHVM